MKNKKIGIIIVLTLVFMNFHIVNTNASSYIHTITSVNELIGNSATIWDKFNNGDIIDISTLESTELGRIYVPETITTFTIKGAADKTFTKFNVTSETPVTITLENINASSSTGPSAFYLPINSQSTLIAVGVNLFKAADNSKCIVGNVTFEGSGDLTIQSGTTTSASNLAHGIYGNVIFNNSGTIKIIGGDGQRGNSTSINGVSTGDAIYGNVECRNTGSIHIEAGDGGAVYSNSSASGGKGGNGGSAINGNLICNGSNTITIKGGTGGYLGLRSTYSTPGTSGSGVLGNVIVKNQTNLTISGGNKRTTGDKDAYGINGYLKVYNNAVVTVIGGNGTLRGSSMGGDGGIGVNGNVSLFDNANVICNGGKGGNGDNGNSYYPSAYGDGGDGNIGINGDVYLNDTSSLQVNGGNGGDGGDAYSTSPTFGTSTGGNGNIAISGNISIGNNCVLITYGGNGGDGGRAKTSNGGNASSAVIGNITTEANIKFISKCGKAGTKYYSATSGKAGTTAYDTIVSTTPILNGGYINTLFYNESKQPIIPIDLDGKNLYLTKITPTVDGAQIVNKNIEIVSNDITYLSKTDESGEIYCYLPTDVDLTLNYGAYSSLLSYIWEDNSTTMFLTLEQVETDSNKSYEITATSNVVNNNIVIYVKSNEEIVTEMLHIALYSEVGQLIDYIIVPTIEPFKNANVPLNFIPNILWLFIIGISTTVNVCSFSIQPTMPTFSSHSFKTASNSSFVTCCVISSSASTNP